MLCLICPTPDDQRPRNGGSDFEALFGGFVRSNQTLWWFVTSGGLSPWKLPPDVYGDDEAEAAFDKQFTWIPSASGYMASGVVFAEVMRYLSDFWIDVYALEQEPATIDIESWWTNPDLPIPIAMPRGAKHAFANVDGSHWAMLSEDEAPMRRVTEWWPLARFVPVTQVDSKK